MAYQAGTHIRRCAECNEEGRLFKMFQSYRPGHVWHDEDGKPRAVLYCVDCEVMNRHKEWASWTEEQKKNVATSKQCPSFLYLPLTRSVADGGGNGSGPFERLTDCPTKHGGSTKLALDDDRPIIIILFMWQFF